MRERHVDARHPNSRPCSNPGCGYLPDCAGNAGKLPPRTEDGMRIAARLREAEHEHGDKPCDDYRCARLPGCAGREGAPLPLDTPADYRSWQRLMVVVPREHIVEYSKTWRARLEEKRKATPYAKNAWMPRSWQMDDMRPRWMAEEQAAIKRDVPSRSASLPRIWADIVPDGHRIRAQLVIPKSDRHSVALAHRICALALDRDQHGSIGGPTFKVRQFCVELYVDCMDGNAAIVAREALEVAASITARDELGRETHIVQRKDTAP